MDGARANAEALYLPVRFFTYPCYNDAIDHMSKNSFKEYTLTVSSFLHYHIRVSLVLYNNYQYYFGGSLLQV